MFWNDNPGGHCGFGALLESENVSLAELLDNDDILQECKSQNKKLLEFLEKSNTIEELVDLITTEPPSDGDPTSRYRNSALACEIITSGMPGLLENLAKEPKLLEKLYSFLDTRPPLNPLLASFFGKTFQVLLARHYGQDWYSYQLMCLRVLEYFKTCSTFLPKLLEHLGTSAIMDTLQNIILIEVEDMKKDISNWLDSQNLIEKLVKLICGQCDGDESGITVEDVSNSTETQVADTPLKDNENGESDKIDSDGKFELEPSKSDNSSYDQSVNVLERLLVDRSENASKLICSMVMKGREPNDDCSNTVTDPLFKKCTINPTIDLLLHSMFSSPVKARRNAIVNGVQVLLALLNDVPGPMQAPSIDQAEIHRIAEAILPYFSKLKDVVTETPPQFKYGYSNLIEKPVGASRLAVIHLLEVLVHLENPAIAESFIKQDFMNILLDMFVEYKWNSFLHTYIVSILKKMFDTTGNKEAYNMHLFVDCKLLDRIIDAWELNDIAQSKKEPRHGYMGHLIQMANFVQNHLILYPDIMNEIPFESRSRWPSLLSEKLDRVNEIQNIYLGGQHPSHTNNNDQHAQHNQQGYADISDIQIQEVHFDNEDDTIDLNGAEQAFRSMCENTSSSLGEHSSMHTWDNNTIVDGLSRDGDFQTSSFSKTIDENVLYGLASKLSNYKTLNNTFEWFTSKNNEWDEADDIDMGSNLQSAEAGSDSSPWGAAENLSNDPVDWADFSNFEEPMNIAKFASSFNCDSLNMLRDMSFSENLSTPSNNSTDITQYLNLSDISPVTNNDMTNAATFPDDGFPQTSNETLSDLMEKVSIEDPSSIETLLKSTQLSENSNLVEPAQKSATSTNDQDVNTNHNEIENCESVSTTK